MRSVSGLISEREDRLQRTVVSAGGGGGASRGTRSPPAISTSGGGPRSAAGGAPIEAGTAITRNVRCCHLKLLALPFSHARYPYVSFPSLLSHGFDANVLNADLSKKSTKENEGGEHRNFAWRVCCF